MNGPDKVVERRIQLTPERAERLDRLAEAHRVSPNRVIERALDILFSLTDLLDEAGERHGWSFLSESALERIWDNEEDAVYDNWRDLYDVPAR